MSRVLYTGVYRDSSGYARAACDYVLALDAAGVDVVCRPLRLNNSNEPIPSRILELESKSSKNCDYVIQHALPHQFSFNGNFKKNIGLFAWETTNFAQSNWPDRLNTMDEVWVINRQQAQAARESGVKRPIKTIPHAADISRFQRSYPTLRDLKSYKDRGDFLFYFVGEFIRRKNIAALLKAFHTEFDPSDPVQLVIKTSVPGMSASEAHAHVKKYCDGIKPGLKLHGGRLDAYKQEVILTERLTEEGIMRLHASCDCMVSPSYGEAFSLPTFDAMAMGKTPIATNWSGFSDYLDDESGWLVDCHEEMVYGILDTPFQDLYTSNEYWAAVDMRHLRKCMREAFENKRLRKEKAGRGIMKAYEYSYESVGALMKEALFDEELARVTRRVCVGA